ncbi:MAG: hypothetical protein ACRC6U_06005, partial [Fusobacteriaceae bacterium]
HCNWIIDTIIIENIFYVYTNLDNSITIKKYHRYPYYINDIMYYNNLSIKERIIFNSIKQLLGWG